MAEIPAIFDQPGAAFVLLPVGIKFPPIEKEWQKKGHTFAEARAHKGNAGIMAGNGFIGLDKDDPTAFDGLELPPTTLWETRPGRVGMWLRGSDNVAEALATIGKKADQSQLKLFTAGKPCGEIKLQRTYQVIPNSHKFIDPVTGDDVAPGKGDRVDYKLLDSSSPATITLAKLLADLQAIGITFSSKLESNAAKLEDIGKTARQKHVETDEARTRRYAEAALRDEVLTMAGSPMHSRNDQLNRSAFAMGQLVAAKVLSENEVISELSRAAENTGLSPDEIRKTIISGLEAGARHPREIPDKTRPNRTGAKGGMSPGPEISDHEFATDGGNAQRLIRLHKNSIKYCHTFKKWMFWDSHRWKIDGDGSAYRFCDDVIREIYAEAGACVDSKDRQEWANFAIRSDSGRGYRDMLFLASFNKEIAITSEQLDVNSWLLNTQNLTIDLKTFEAREPSRSDFITKSIGTSYDRAAKCPLWIKFIDRIFAGDAELIAYIKRAVGYSLTGSMAEQVFFFCHGDGSNGKSKFLAVLRSLLGDYAKQADFSSFLIQRNEKIRNDLASLAGARVITAIEAEEGSRLSMSVIKAWVGGDPITARFLFGENFTFQPTGKLWLAANNRPAISERNHAAWRRVQLIPFAVTIPEAEQDKELESKLLKELPGILNWALDGLADYLKVGLKTPPAVQVATAKYRKENDSLEEFLSECCDIAKLKVCKNTDLYNAYLNFCGMSGLKALSQTKFSPELNQRPGVSSARTMHGITWTGIDLKEEWTFGGKQCRVDNPCRVEHNPTSITGDLKHVDLEKNAQSFQYSPHERNLAQNPTYPTYPTLTDPTGNDSLKSNPTSNPTFNVGLPVVEDGSKMSKIDRPTPKKNLNGDPGLQRFKAGVQSRSKNTCRLCGQHFEIPLTIGYQGGYICEPCRRDGPPPEPAKDSQGKLAGRRGQA
jgi:putative DNA primase/helicase